ncbi:unnamed protein product [Ectocarpus sp. CCAP 1310/34]|nr:unnamed protein product [Ectocarpus sp. CCAP 1310/34]
MSLTLYWDQSLPPYENLSVLLLYQLVHKYQVSEAMLTGLLAILRTRHTGKGFDVDDIRHITAKHFYGRRITHHPLLAVVETFVPSSKDNGTSVPVYDKPCNLLVNRKIQSPSSSRHVCRVRAVKCSEPKKQSQMD